MGDAIGQMLPSAFGVAISPLPIVALVLMFVTPAAKSNGPAFVIGWWPGVAVVGGIVLALASGAGAIDNAEPADWVSWLKLGLGLLFLALRQGQSRRAKAETPGWMSALAPNRRRHCDLPTIDDALTAFAGGHLPAAGAQPARSE
ncbi:MAG TPA: GAP family protein [Dehalococcoidia bacterium]|nr:GAP family protein [Dehalococcoidia bacterium]